MKPFLCIDVSADKNNEVVNGEELIAVRPSEMLSGALEGAARNAGETMERAQLPTVLRVLQWICGMAAALIVVGIAKAFGRESLTLAQAYTNAPALFWIGGVCLVAWAILRFAASRKNKTVMESDEGSYSMAKLDSVVNTVMGELGVPGDAMDVDVLTFRYTVKNGEIKPKQGALDFTAYVNSVYKLFADSDCVYLADVGGKFEIPRSELRRISTVNKRISVPEWNKETPPTKGEYKQYKLTTNNYDCIFFKPYHILEFEHAGETWGIYFACYDLPAFEAVTGLKAE